MKLSYFLLVTTILSLPGATWAMIKERDEENRFTPVHLNHDKSNELSDEEEYDFQDKLSAGIFPDENSFIKKYLHNKPKLIAYSLFKNGKNIEKITGLKDEDCFNTLNLEVQYALTSSSDEKTKGFYLSLLAFFVDNKIGTSKPIHKAIEWYKQAIDLKNSTAMNNLADIYFYGRGEI